MARLASALSRALSRQTSGGRFVPEVDGLRFIAIVAVLLFHVGGYALARAAPSPGGVSAGDLSPLQVVVAPGYVGVQIFFAISGLILGLPFARARLASGPQVGLGAYLLRRATRLEPPYLISLLVWTAVLIVMKDGRVGELLPHLAASAVYLHGAVYGEPSVISGVAWSLEVEVQFYLLAPLLACVFALRRKVVRRTVLVIGIVCSAAWQGLLSHPSVHNPLMGLTLAHQFHWFLVGFLVADMMVCEWRESAPPGGRSGSLADLAGTAGVACLWWLLQPSERPTWIAHAVGPACVLTILIAAFRGRIWRWAMTRPPIYLIGGMCYTIYLYHSLFKAAIGGVTTRWQLGWSIESQAVIQTGLIVGSILVVSAFLFVAFERPFMRRFFAGRDARERA